MTFIAVRHNIEVAHRLYELPGKCQNIHGHSMLIEMQLHGYPNKHGVLEDLPFGDVKKRFRAHLDEVFDHHLLLNENDPWAHPLAPIGAPIADYRMLPGLVVMPNDPTTENLARWIAEWSINEFNLHVEVTVDETGTNSAGYMMAPRIGD